MPVSVSERVVAGSRDRRRLPTGAACDAVVVAERAIRLINATDRVLARALAEIERDRAYVAYHASSASHWAVLRGFDKERADSLLCAGRLMLKVPEAERQMRAGEITPQTAGVVGRLVPPVPRLEPKEPVPADVAAAEEEAVTARAERFLGRAQETSRSKLRREVAEERERVKQGEAVVPVRFFVKERVRDEWRLAKRIAVGRAGRGLTEGQAFSSVVADYVKRYDRDDLSGRKLRRVRRAGPTSAKPDSRGIPAEVRRLVMQRAEGHCEFPGCPVGTMLQFCHITPHAEGGDREPGNFVVLCRHHHVDFDLGTLGFFERTEAGVTFVDLATGELFEPSPRTHAADVLPRPTPGRDVRQSKPSDAAGRDEPTWRRRDELSNCVRETVPPWAPGGFPAVRPAAWQRRSAPTRRAAAAAAMATAFP
jgi:hypothetical protein